MNLLPLILLSHVVAAPGFPVTARDAQGAQVTLDRPPQRIVSLAPSLTECAFAIGLGPRIVGVTRFCDYPPAARGKAKVGGYSVVSVEKVLSLRPDLVLAARGNPEAAIRRLRRLGVKVFAFQADRFRDIQATLRVLGRLTAADSGAARVIARLDAAVAEVRERVGSTPRAKRPRVFFGGVEAPFFTPGPDTYLNDLIELAGGRNIAAHAKVRWPQLSLEAIVAANPDVIVCGFTHHAHFAKSEDALRFFRGKAAWRRVAAVRAGRVYVVDPDPYMRPGPRAARALRELARCLYPDRFSLSACQARP